MRMVPALPAAILLVACTTAAEPQVPGCYEGPCIAIGESQQLPGIVVEPLEVLEDSRCPIEADCIWEGEVRINTQLTLGHEVITSELTTQQPLRINGGDLHLVEVAPDASTQWPQLEDGNYRFRFAFVPD